MIVGCPSLKQSERFSYVRWPFQVTSLYLKILVIGANECFDASVSFDDNMLCARKRSARHGFEWWQFDITWQCVRLLKALGLASNVKLPSEKQKQRMAIA